MSGRYTWEEGDVEVVERAPVYTKTSKTTTESTETHYTRGDSNECHDPNSGEFCGEGGGAGMAFIARRFKSGHKDERPGVNWYAGSRNGMAMNQALREGRMANLSRQHEAAVVDLTKEIAAEPPLAGDTVVYRGVDKDFAGKLKVGDEFVDKGFTSTTIDEGLARFSRSGKPVAVMDFELPKGTYALTVKGSSEKEIIVQRSSRYRVVAKRSNGEERLRLRAIGTQDFKKEKKPWTFDALASGTKPSPGDTSRFLETGKGLKIERPRPSPSEPESEPKDE